MKLVYFDDFKLGVLKGDAVIDVSSVVRDIPHTGPHDLISGLIARFADYRGRLEQATSNGGGVSGPLGRTSVVSKPDCAPSQAMASALGSPPSTTSLGTGS